MNDPHVVALNYVIVHGDSIDYSEAEPLCRDEPGFRLTVEDRKARFAFKEHHASEEHAREAVAEYIRVWQFDAALRYGNPDAFRLVFERAEIVDRNPTPGEVRLSGKLTVNAGVGTARLTTVVRQYPSPPSDIALSTDAETMHQRYMGYRGKHEPLQSMAYFCLSMLEDPGSATERGRTKNSGEAQGRRREVRYRRIGACRNRPPLDHTGRGGREEAGGYGSALESWGTSFPGSER